MPLTQGKMLMDHKRKIKKNLRDLMRNMDAKDLIDYFIENEIFDYPDKEAINGSNPNSTENRNNCFFALLFRSEDKAYYVLLKSLRENGLDHLANKIENTQLENSAQAVGTEPHEWINNIQPTVKSRRLSEKDISRLAQTLGDNWELVLLGMGIKQVELEHSKMDNSTAVMKIYAALNKWRLRCPDVCTLDNFVRIAKNCSQATTVDWQQVKDIAEDMDLLSLAEALEKPADTFVSVAVYVIYLTGPQTYKNKDVERRYFCATVADTSDWCLLRIYKRIPSMTPGASVFLNGALRKTGENQIWVVSSTKVSPCEPIQVPQTIIDFAMNNGSIKKDGPTKLADAITSNTPCNILAKVVQTSPLKYRRNGELPIKFLAMQDCSDHGPVKIALFGEDAQRDFTEGVVLSITDTYRWNRSHTLSTKKSSKIEYRPQDLVDLPQMGPRFDDKDFTADNTNSSGSEPEEFQVVSVTLAHKYQCCPKSECRNKKLKDGTCPMCNGQSFTQQSYYCLAKVVLKRSMGTNETRTLFKRDLELIVNLPDLRTMQEDPALYDFLTASLPINARGAFHDGNLTIQTAKRPRDC